MTLSGHDDTFLLFLQTELKAAQDLEARKAQHDAAGKRRQ
jgi:hypothetical protein